LDKVPIVTAPWLSQADTSYTLIPTHIKQLRTTAPKDMKAAKESRNKERVQARQRKRLNLKAKRNKDSITMCGVTSPFVLVQSFLLLLHQQHDSSNFKASPVSLTGL
jgi:hypothetical protein